MLRLNLPEPEEGEPGVSANRPNISLVPGNDERPTGSSAFSRRVRKHTKGQPTLAFLRCVEAKCRAFARYGKRVRPAGATHP